MDVLLVRPPEPQMSRFYNKGESLGLGYIAAVLRQSGVETEIADCVLLDWDHATAVREILRKDFKVLALTVFAVAMDDAAALVQALRAGGCDAHITMGGHFPSFRATEVLGEFAEIDSVVKFEGEFVVRDLALAVRDGHSLEGIQGLIFRSKGVVHENSPRPPIRDLNGLPFPARDMLPLALEWERDALICTSRGCWARCTYCSIAPFSRVSGAPAWRARSPQNVVDELQFLVETYAPPAIGVVDADFVGPGKVGRRRSMEIAMEIMARKLELQLGIYTRVDEVDLELFAMLRTAGMTTVYLGIESGVQAALDRWDKRTTVEENYRALDLCASLGLTVEAGFMMYDPYTTLEEISENLEFLRRTEAFDFPSLLARMEVRPGMPMEAQLRSEGRLSGNYRDSRYSMIDPRAEVVHTGACRILEPLAMVYLHLRDLRSETSVVAPALDLLSTRLNLKALGFLRDFAGLVAEIAPSSFSSIGGHEAAFIREAEAEASRLLRMVEALSEMRSPVGGVSAA